MQDDGSDATLVKSNDWRQGSIFSDALVDELRKASVLPEVVDHESRWIVISHDCGR